MFPATKRRRAMLPRPGHSHWERTHSRRFDSSCGRTGKSTEKFVYRDASGRVTSVRIIRHYWTKPIVHPFAKIDRRLDPKLTQAATFAEERANGHSQAQCWHYVKHALFSAGVISSYPKTAFAAEAGDELMHSYGFKRLPNHDPYAAPVGAVLVYGDRNHGHVEIRTKDGFVSDLSQQVSLLLPADRGLRKIRFVKFANQLREQSAMLPFARAMEFAFPFLGKPR